jgi:hypothetical protein
MYYSSCLIVRVHQVGFNFNFNLYKMHGDYNIKWVCSSGKIVHYTSSVTYSA